MLTGTNLTCTYVDLCHGLLSKKVDPVVVNCYRSELKRNSVSTRQRLYIVCAVRAEWCAANEKTRGSLLGFLGTARAYRELFNRQLSEQVEVRSVHASAEQHSVPVLLPRVLAANSGGHQHVDAHDHLGGLQDRDHEAEFAQRVVDNFDVERHDAVVHVHDEVNHKVHAGVPHAAAVNVATVHRRVPAVHHGDDVVKQVQEVERLLSQGEKCSVDPFQALGGLVDEDVNANAGLGPAVVGLAQHVVEPELLNLVQEFRNNVVHSPPTKQTSDHVPNKEDPAQLECWAVAHDCPEFEDGGQEEARDDEEHHVHVGIFVKLLLLGGEVEGSRLLRDFCVVGGLIVVEVVRTCENGSGSANGDDHVFCWRGLMFGGVAQHEVGLTLAGVGNIVVLEQFLLLLRFQFGVGCRASLRLHRFRLGLGHGARFTRGGQLIGFHGTHCNLTFYIKLVASVFSSTVK